MPAFAYQAIDTHGKTHKGVLQAESPRSARASLRDRGLNPLQVDALAESAKSGTGLGRSLTNAQLVLVTRQLAALIGSGLPIDEALSALADSSEGRLRAQMVGLRSRVMEGASLAQAMAETPGTFPPLYRATVAAGESAGKLAPVMQRLADYAESRDAMRRRVLLALAYPALLSIIAVLVVCGLMIWVVPQVVGVFAHFGGALPWPTRVLIGFSDVLRSQGGVLFGLLAAAVVVVFVASRNAGVRKRWQGFLLRVPLLGRLLRAADTARFARTLALLVGSAVPLLEALSIAGHVVTNVPLREALARAALRVREGQGLARALSDTGQFPPIPMRLIASGEKSGRLDEMLFEAAAHSERELDTAVGLSTAVLGPGVILLVGGLVLFIVLAILLPIFELNTLIR